MREKNKEKLSQLLPRVQWAANRWNDECFKKDLEFTVTEVYRSQRRQNELWAKGRTRPGRIVTWTTSSKHTQRLACDIYDEKGRYKEIGKVALQYGITRPLAGYPYYDEGHFEFDRVGTFPIVLSAEAKARALVRLLKRAKERGLDGLVNMVQGTLKRLQERFRNMVKSL